MYFLAGAEGPYSLVLSSEEEGGGQKEVIREENGSPPLWKTSVVSSLRLYSAKRDFFAVTLLTARPMKY